MTRTALVAGLVLAIEIAPLRALSGWEPVGSLVEQVLGGLRGEGGLSRAEIARVRAWSARWKQVDPDIRAFYAAAVTDPAIHGDYLGLVEAGLWYLLQGGETQPRPSQPQEALLRRLYEGWHGSPPSADILPARLGGAS